MTEWAGEAALTTVHCEHEGKVGDMGIYAIGCLNIAGAGVSVRLTGERWISIQDDRSMSVKIYQELQNFMKGYHSNNYFILHFSGCDVNSRNMLLMFHSNLPGAYFILTGSPCISPPRQCWTAFVLPGLKLVWTQSKKEKSSLKDIAIIKK